MTAHELARKLLEGPDVLVFCEQDDDYGARTEPVVIDAVEPVTLWQVNYGLGWSGDYSFDAPRNQSLPARSVEALKLF